MFIISTKPNHNLSTQQVIVNVEARGENYLQVFKTNKDAALDNDFCNYIHLVVCSLRVAEGLTESEETSIPY